MIHTIHTVPQTKKLTIDKKLTFSDKIKKKNSTDQSLGCVFYHTITTVESLFHYFLFIINLFITVLSFMMY